MLSYYGKQVMIDCGEDWQGDFEDLNPDAIVLTHAHPDHAWGLKDGTDIPVYATKTTWEAIKDYAITDRSVVEPRKPFTIARITLEFFPVDHSTLAPAGGYRVTTGEVTIFYIPDVVYIPEREEALGGARIYIGDGATITRSMVRKLGPEVQALGDARDVKASIAHDDMEVALR